MYDFERWKAWLEIKTSELQTNNVAASLHIRSAGGLKPGLGFRLVGHYAMGDFENWITGETDYTIFAPPNKEAKMVSNKWMVVLTDTTFEGHFEEFIAEFYKYNTIYN